ncbi:DUF305 domain-containing protein [Saccharopolyspora rosea]|uniref:DUF305 domain-containing protein n=1 Tax=Saccharopolyspora rosea TaxID=524884 RepID=A0ABW3G4W4_9PSEU
MRVLTATAGTLALLLLGAALGLLIKVPTLSADPRPTAVDTGFAQDMTTHHQQAVTMATLARERTSDAAVRQLAFDIDTNQRDQIGRMQGWLDLWGQPAQPTGPAMQWMTAQHHHAASLTADARTTGPMPGMATADELSRLRALRGPEFDVYFLQLMLRHHEGGAPMADYGARHAAVPAVRELAANMLGAQRAEAEFMRRMLAARHAGVLPSR